MNAAFVMLTSAWLAGADPAPPAAAAPAPAPAAAAPAVVSTGNGCGATAGGCGATCGDDACCDRQRKKLLSGLFGKLKGKFNRNDDCCAPTCAPVCPAPAPAPCPPPCPPKPVCCAPAPACNTCADDCDSGRKKLLAGLKGKFRKGRNDCCGGVDACCGTAAPAAAPVAPAPAPAAEPKKMPTTIGGAKYSEEGVRNPFELTRRYEGQAASASPDYSKLTGQLYFVHTDGGRWVLRFAPISKEDRFGGSMVLARNVDMSAFREGDRVSVEGEVLAEKAGSTLGGALYRADKVRLVERRQGTTAE